MLPAIKINVANDDKKIIARFYIKDGIIDFRRFKDKKIHEVFSFHELTDLIVKSIEQEMSEEQTLEETYFSTRIDIDDDEDGIEVVDVDQSDDREDKGEQVYLAKIKKMSPLG